MNNAVLEIVGIIIGTSLTFVFSYLATTLKTAIKDIQQMKIDLAVLNNTVAAALELKEIVSADHNDIVILKEKVTGIQIGLNKTRENVSRMTTNF